MNKNGLFLLLGAVVLYFSACGGDSGTASGGSTKLSNADMEVETYNQLPSCAEKREGKTAFVADQEQGYVCKKGEWVEDDAVEVKNSSSVSSSSLINGSSEIKKGTLTDSRDGQTYKTVTIGTQTWMAENLNYAEVRSFLCL